MGGEDILEKEGLSYSVMGRGRDGLQMDVENLFMAMEMFCILTVMVVSMVYKSVKYSSSDGTLQIDTIDCM